VSFALRLAGDAAVDLAALDPWVGEESVDELDRLTADPSRLRPDAQGEAVFDFERETAGIRHAVFVRIHIDNARLMLTILSIRDVVRPGVPPPDSP
jgi:hypothetical protein